MVQRLQFIKELLQQHGTEEGTDVVFNAFNGPVTGYVAANYNVVTSVNDIDSWLITPANNVTCGSL